MDQGQTLTFNLEQEALGCYNYLGRLVDPDTGFTYFDVYLTNPAEAAHDWPDFLDVPGRSAETSVLLRHMTGRTVATEDVFFRRIYGFQEDDGWFWRPETKITRHEVVHGENVLDVAPLVARAVADGDAEAEQRLDAMLGALETWAKTPDYGMPEGFIRPLSGAYDGLGLSRALDLAVRFGKDAQGGQTVFREDGSFPGHVHSHLYFAAGLTELARLTGDEALLAHMDRVFEFISGCSTAFGFVPEVTERQDDVIACETCCLMDYVHLALSLAKAGRTERFDDLERAVRNHLAESRVRHGDWLPSSPDATDDELILRRGVQERVVGAWAGWSGPNHILAYDEYLPAAWLKTPDLAPIYLGKVRALQNCCGPSGPKALYLAWQHAARMDGTTLRVNLLMDRALPEAEVRGFEPWDGRVEVAVRAPIDIAVRVPGFVKREDLAATVNGNRLDLRFEGGYVVTPKLSPGDRVVFTYPLAEKTETISVGNEGFQQYDYAVKWRGSTVLGLEPGENATMGKSNLMAEPVRLYYGAEGPHPIYQREGMLDATPTPGPLNETPGPDVW